MDKKWLQSYYWRSHNLSNTCMINISNTKINKHNVNAIIILYYPMNTMLQTLHVYEYKYTDNLY